MQDLSNDLHVYKVFSKIDLVKGYHQIPVAAADIPKNSDHHAIWFVWIFVYLIWIV